MNAEFCQKLASEVGTPLYAFDLGALRSRIDYLKSNLPADVVLCYAMKANPFLVRDMTGYVDRFEVCSPGEYHICQTVGVPYEKLVISGVYKHPDDVEDMVGHVDDMGCYTVESLRQLELLQTAAAKHEKVIPVLLRLTSGNQFGLDEEELVNVIRDRGQYPNLHIRGVQHFSGTQRRTLKRLSRELAGVVALLDRLEQECGYVASDVEFGTGFPVNYFTQEEDFDETAFLQGFGELLAPLTARWHVTLEVGRSIAASCGTFLTSVVDLKHNKGQNYAILDGGIHHLVYYGQMMAMKVPHFQLLPLREDTDPQPWNLCGSLCTINDLIVKQLPVTDLAIGDVFAFERTGAYSMCEGISLFLSRDLPAVVLVNRDGSCTTVRGHQPTYPVNTP